MRRWARRAVMASWSCDDIMQQHTLFQRVMCRGGSGMCGTHLQHAGSVRLDVPRQHGCGDVLQLAVGAEPQRRNTAQGRVKSSNVTHLQSRLGRTHHNCHN